MATQTQDTQTQPLDRSIIRCINCGLNQFMTSTDRCRRCNQLYLKPEPRRLVKPRIKAKDSRINPTRLGIKLRELREARGLTQVDLAYILGKLHAYISLIENGRIEVSPLNFVKFCNALKVPPAQVIHSLECIEESIETLQIYYCMVKLDRESQKKAVTLVRAWLGHSPEV